MLRSRGWAGLRWTVATVGLCALMARGAVADAIDTTSDVELTATETEGPSVRSDMSYSTSGSIGLTGISGPNVISFVPEASGAFTSPSAFSLGTFVVGYLPPGVVTSYDHTPFSITYSALKVNGVEPDPNQSPITVTGFLNGSVTGPTQSDVVATFSPIANPTFLTGEFVNKLSVLDPQVSLVPSTTNGGRTTAQGHLRVSAAPVPEPATIALFGTLAVGLGLRRRLRARAAA
jgi:hypothetical protein